MKVIIKVVIFSKRHKEIRKFSCHHMLPHTYDMKKFSIAQHISLKKQTHFVLLYRTNFGVKIRRPLATTLHDLSLVEGKRAV